MWGAVRGPVRLQINAYAESLFRTAKYRPGFPAKGFASLVEAKLGAAELVRWYKVHACHSGIRDVSPQQRHPSGARAVLAARHGLYLPARQGNPARWSGNTRDGSHTGLLTLNPGCDMAVNLSARAQHTWQKAE